MYFPLGVRGSALDLGNDARGNAGKGDGELAPRRALVAAPPAEHPSLPLLLTAHSPPRSHGARAGTGAEKRVLLRGQPTVVGL